jgi:uncharacterized protein YeaO (DUF488 family)
VPERKKRRTATRPFASPACYAGEVDPDYMWAPGRGVRLKRAYERPAKEDGTRVLVERLWPRGLAKERAAIDDWLKDVAPSPELRRWYGHRTERWPEFQRRYRAELETGAARAALEKLRALGRDRKLTLVFAAKDEAHSSAAVLKDVLGT